MEDFELKLGGFKFKGVYLAVFLPIVGSIIGGVWTASEFYNRIVSLEESVADTGGLDKRIQTLEENYDNNDLANLQGKLAELATNLKTIMESQKELLDLKDQFKDIDVTAKENALLVKSFEDRIKILESKIKVHQREIDDIWKAMDALANPLG